MTRLRYDRPVDLTGVLHSSHSVYDMATRRAKFFNSLMRLQLTVTCSLSTYQRLVHFQLELPR